MNRIFAFGNALGVFAFIKEATKFWLYIPEERKESICNDQSQMSLIRRLFRVSYEKVFTTKAQSSPSSENLLSRALPSAPGVCPETCMMDVEAHHECSIRDTMVEILAIGSRRHFDGKPNIYSPGV
jgi:hypothetical protein